MVDKYAQTIIRVKTDIKETGLGSICRVRS